MAAGAVEVNVTTNNSKAGTVFDGVDDYVEVAHNANQLGANLTNGFTISAWINPRGVGEGNSGRILNKSGGGGSTNGFSLQINSSLGFTLSVAASGTDGVSTNGVSPIGEWKHVLATFSAAGISNFFINSSPTGTLNQNLNTTVANITTTTPARIGNQANATDRTFDGSISKVKMWNRVLTSAEIALDYAGSPVDDGLILDVPLQDDYSDNKGNAVTNSGSILSIRDDAIAAAIKADRTTANDKYLMVGMPGGQVVSAVIEEAP